MGLELALGSGNPTPVAQQGKLTLGTGVENTDPPDPKKKEKNCKEGSKRSGADT